MRQGGPGGRRPRGRHHGGGNGGNGGGNGGGGNGGPPPGAIRDNRPRSAASLRHQTFDSNGPDVRVRGNAWQVYEKYLQLARDASGSGDRVGAENYQQHAEHYYRIIEAINEATNAEQRQRGGAPAPQTFGQQPEIPPNYYAPDGNLMPPPVPGAPVAAPAADGTPQPPAQAEVQLRNPPPAPPPFFASDESEEGPSGPEPLLARR